MFNKPLRHMLESVQYWPIYSGKLEQAEPETLPCLPLTIRADLAGFKLTLLQRLLDGTIRL